MKKFFKTFLLSFLIVFGLSFSSAVFARGVTGWAWSSNIGEISFNSLNCDPDGNGFAGPGAPAGCPADGTAMATYAVTIAADGNMIGQSWSSNIGWIDFDPAGPFPPGFFSHSARVDNPHLATSTVSGWARACAVFITGCSGDLDPNRGGWNGWISMRGTAVDGSSYGVSVNFTTNEFSGGAWSDTAIGWISFNSLNCDPDGNGFAGPGAPAGCPADGTAMTTYAVILVTPELHVTPTTISVILEEGTGTTTIGTVNVTNPGAGSTLTWSQTDDRVWLTATPASGTTTIETDTVTVQVTTVGLAIGTHTGTITFVGAAPAIGTPNLVTVTLTIAPPFAANVSGWAWSSNIGWISLNRLNCDPDGNGLAGPGTPVGCPADGTAIPAYGVTLAPVVDGVRNMTGYAWSSNIGWIDFNPAGPFPAAPNHSARIDNPHLPTSTVSGWARALAHDGGWDGWIKTQGSEYNTSLNFVNREFSGWAWSENIGWISFNHLNCEVASPPLGCPPSGTTIPDYEVIFINFPPEVREPLTAAADHCAVPQRYTFSWTFHDRDLGDTQSKLRLQVVTSTVDIGVGPYTIDRTVTSTVSSYAPLDLFAWNTTYNWRVMVWDSHNSTSTWSTVASFTTPVHRPPNISFTWSPERPAINEVVQFTDATQCFGPGGVSATCTAWSWDFGNGLTSTLRHPTTTYTVAGRYNVRLTVTDPSGTGDPALSCTSTRAISIAAGPPIWIEIPPIIWLREMWASVVNIAQIYWNRAMALVNGF